MTCHEMRCVHVSESQHAGSNLNSLRTPGVYQANKNSMPASTFTLSEALGYGQKQSF